MPEKRLHNWMLLVSVAILLSTSNAVLGIDSQWSTYRGNQSRSAFADVNLPAELQLEWRFDAPQPPQPAWPPPARGSYWQRLASIEPRVVDDHAFHPVIAGSLVLFGSSADDTLRALDLATGRLKWQYVCEGPIRYAPTVASERVYWGCDDGYVYCVQLVDGQLVWRRRLGPKDRRLPGNGRLISTWPIRTGPIVSNDSIIAFAGLFPSQGVYGAALNLATGEPLWQVRTEQSPQGYLLLDDERLIVPLGRASPAVYSASDGEFVGGIPGSGGAFALLRDGKVISGRGNSNDLLEADAKSRARLAQFKGRQMAISPDMTFLLKSSRLVAIDRQNPSDSSSFSELNVAWTSEVIDGESLACTRQHVIVGGHNYLQVVDAATGEVQQRVDFKGQLEGRVLGIALCDGRIIVSTDKGRIGCLGADVPSARKALVGREGRPESFQSNPQAKIATNANSQLASQVRNFLDDNLPPNSGPRRGYCVVLGAGWPDLLDVLLDHTAYHTIVLVSDHQRWELARRSLIDQGVYGTRVTVLPCSGPRLPFVSRFANLVIRTKASNPELDSDWYSAELRRIMVPGRGLHWTVGDDLVMRAPLRSRVGSWTHLYGSPANTAHSGDELVHSDLELQWFGGPGPQHMTDRHLRAHAPLADRGRMIIPGENKLIAIDAYNGTKLWERDVPQSHRYSIPYDGGYLSLDRDRLAIAVQQEAWLIDVNTGNVRERIPLPEIPLDQSDNVAESDPMVWGYLASIDNRLYATAQSASSARTKPSRDLIDVDYRNNRPLVTSRCFFALNAETGKVRWSYNGSIVNTSICISRDHVVFLDGHVRDEDDQGARRVAEAAGRVVLKQLLGKTAALVCLDRHTGREVWRRSVPESLRQLSNIFYVQSSNEKVVLSGSLLQDNDTLYRLVVLHEADGQTVWSGEHWEGKPGAFTHGEQVHHPILLEDRIVAEPAIYRLADGARLGPDGKEADWRLVRPGHSCGTLSAGGDCLFFRSSNPTVLSLSAAMDDESRMRKLAPSRPGCWINIIPAEGMVLIPEASASCVCLYSLQTSMGFSPRDQADSN